MSRPVLHNKRAAFVASSIDSKLWIPFSKQEKLFFHNCCSAVDTVLLTSPKKKENNCVSGYHRKPTSVSGWEECGSDRVSRVAPATWINCSALFSSHLLYSLTPVIFSSHLWSPPRNSCWVLKQKCSSFKVICCCCSVAKLCPPLLWRHGLQTARLLCPWDFSGKNTRVGCHFILQGIFPTQGLNSCLLHWQAGSLALSQQGDPWGGTLIQKWLSS